MLNKRIFMKKLIMLIVVLVLSIFLVGCGTCPEIPEYDCPDCVCPACPDVSCPTCPVAELKLPEIVLFECTRDEGITLRILLSWIVVEADVISLTSSSGWNSFEEATDIRTFTLSPGSITTFTLTATNLDGVSTASITIIVE